MCVVLSPAGLEDTTIVAVRYSDGWDTLFYANVVTTPPENPLRGFSVTGRRSVVSSPGLVPPFESSPRPGTRYNAMILPIPAKGEFGRANVISTKGFPNLVKPIAEAIPSFDSIFRGSRSLSMQGEAKSVEVWQDGGYTFLTSHDANALEEALEQGGYRRSVEIPVGLIPAYAGWYPGWPILLALFEYGSQFKPHPIMVHYQSMYRSMFLPGLDSHDGTLPKQGEMVDVDHVLAASVPEIDTTMARRVILDGNPNTTGFSRMDLYPRHVVGKRFPKGRNLLPNGDWWLDPEEVRAGVFNPVRKFPAELIAG